MSVISSFLPIKELNYEKAIQVVHVATSARQQFLEMLNSGKCYVYGIVIFNKTLGRIILFTDLDDKDLADGKNICYFSNLWVHPKLRGQKIGTKLVNYVEKEAKNKGFKYLALGVHEDNEKNLSIYKHLGFDQFVKNRSQNVFAKDKNGDFITVKEYSVFMKKL